MNANPWPIWPGTKFAFEIVPFNPWPLAELDARLEHLEDAAEWAEWSRLQGEYRAVRAGDWKLQISAHPDRAWLFNLRDDPIEHTDLSAAQPERVAELRALIEAQNAEMPPPLWPALLEGAVRIDVPLNTPCTHETASDFARAVGRVGNGISFGI